MSSGWIVITQQKVCGHAQNNICNIYLLLDAVNISMDSMSDGEDVEPFPASLRNIRGVSLLNIGFKLYYLLWLFRRSSSLPPLQNYGAATVTYQEPIYYPTEYSTW